MRFEDVASPAAFFADPRQAWGFYGHRLNLYRDTEPHAGYRILLKWAEAMQHGAFVFTSNVDGHFAKAGFAEDRIAECHGSIHRFQCINACTSTLWPTRGTTLEVDEARCRLISPLPTCPRCGAIARPNILMFYDGDWIEAHVVRQRARLERWLSGVRRAVVIELGAGLAVPTVRQFSERHGPRVIRINTRDFVINPSRGVGIEGEALDVLKQLEGMLGVDEIHGDQHDKT
jgi:NAD-dependent SIR2 family protein deacetylase